MRINMQIQEFYPGSSNRTPLNDTTLLSILACDGVLVVNPGSASLSAPRSTKFTPTVALYDTKTHQATIHSLSR